MGQRKKTKFVNSIMDFPSGRLTEEVLFDERFGCLEEEINKGAQTFIKVVGDFLANAVEVGVVTVW